MFSIAAALLLSAGAYSGSAKAAVIVDTTGWHADLIFPGTPITLAGASTPQYGFHFFHPGGLQTIFVLRGLDGSTVAAPGTSDYLSSAITETELLSVSSQVPHPGDYGLHFTVNGVDYVGFATVDATGKFISQISYEAVPELATWALMLVGFGGIGLAMRRRRGLRRLQPA
jgi:hypothetical protein